MADVWVVRDADARACGVSSHNVDGAINDALTAGNIDRVEFFGLLNAMQSDGIAIFNGYTLTRETLLTPAHAAVIAAAKYEVAHHWYSTEQLRIAVATLRALEGDA
jgi:hypothetical protein